MKSITVEIARQAPESGDFHGAFESVWRRTFHFRILFWNQWIASLTGIEPIKRVLISLKAQELDYFGQGSCQ